MIKHKHIYLFQYLIGVCFSIMLSTCITPFEFEPDESLEVLVVEGLLTDDSTRNYVHLFRSSSFNDTEEIQVTNATVRVESSDGNVYNYTNQLNGDYTPPAGFVGIPGETYQLFIEVGVEVYYTEPNLLLPPNETRVTGRAVNIPDPEIGSNIDGVQFFIESEDEPTASHFRFEWEDTYQIIVPFPRRYLYVDGEIVETGENLGICYKTEQSDQIIIKSILQQTEKSLVDFPIRFRREGSQAYRTKYSLITRQYTLSSEAYSYYDKLKKNNEGGGSLFDKQNGPLLGNIQNDNQKTALGFFQVSGVTELREYYRLPQFGDQLRVPRFEPACPESLILSQVDSVGIMQDIGWGLYDVVQVGPASYEYHMNFWACTDCRYLGDINRPEWWE